MHLGRSSFASVSKRIFQLDGYDFQALNGVQAIDRLFQRALPLSGPGSSIPQLPLLEEAVPDDIVAVAPAPAPAPAPSPRRPGERLAAMQGRKGFGADFFAAAGQTVRDESPRSLLKKHNALLSLLFLIVEVISDHGHLVITKMLS